MSDEWRYFRLTIDISTQDEGLVLNLAADSIRGAEELGRELMLSWWRGRP